MRGHRLVACVAFFCVTIVFVGLEASGQAQHDRALLEAEPRLRAIYEGGEYRARGFDADWLPDGSGYTVVEPVEGGRPVRARYDAASGERTVVSSPGGDRGRSGGDLSPDGRRVLYADSGGLRVRNLRSGEVTVLLENKADDSVSFRRSSWSPDGKRIAFLRSDSSRVRQRAFLVPSDPSYPEVRETRFARVGETISRLRVGVVDDEGRETRWLSLPEPEEGFYIEQVAWAGNSDELLVEKLSRFRNEREFLLADVNTGALRRIFHESDPAWVIASIRKNVGL
ncbi:MAG: DPP IV N-terminal domain-containing protein, partial [Planctomycetota bacterium]